MDMLQKYQQGDWKAPERQSISANAESSDGFFIRAVIKLSGGKIRDRRSVFIILLIFVLIIVLASAWIVIQNTGVPQHPIITAPQT